MSAPGLAEPPPSLAFGPSSNGSNGSVAQPLHTSSSDGDDHPDDFDAGHDSSDSDNGPAHDGADGHAAGEVGGGSGGGSRAAKRKRKNVSRACDRCRERKIKCSGACKRVIASVCMGGAV